MAPCVSQSVVAGSSTVTSALESGVTLISHLMLRCVAVPVQPPGPDHRASRHRERVVPQRLVAEVFLGVLAEAQLEGEPLLRRRATPARSWMAAVSGVSAVFVDSGGVLLLGDGQGWGGQPCVAGQRLGVAPRRR